MNNRALQSIPQIPSREEKDVEFEKYSSLINIFKGYEEYTLDPNGIIISSNLEAVNITGYEEWEVIGKKISIFYTAEDQLTGKPGDDLLKSEKRGSIVFTGLWMKKRNAHFLARIRISAMKENNVVVGYKMILQDATYKAVSNHKIKKIKDEYLSLFNNSFVGIIKINMSDYSVFMINDKAEKMIAWESGRESLRFDKIFDSTGDFVKLEKNLVDEKRVEDFQFKLKGTNRWLMTSLRYFSCENFAEGILIDVTELREKEREIIRLNHELDQFIYHASHELRSPLATMLGIINLIKLEKADSIPTNYTTLLEQKVHKLDGLLKNIAAITYNNKVELSCEHIYWKNLIESCFKESFQSNEKIQLESSVVQFGDFQNDPGRIRIIINNILSNALKYQNPNAATQEIHLKLFSDSQAATIIITDNGIGIDQKYLNNVFNMFYKAHADSSDGNGLGLYLVKIMIDKLGGNINVESKIGIGTTFRVHLPAITPK